MPIGAVMVYENTSFLCKKNIHLTFQYVLLLQNKEKIPYKRRYMLKFCKPGPPSVSFKCYCHTVKQQSFFLIKAFIIALDMLIFMVMGSCL